MRFNFGYAKLSSMKLSGFLSEKSSLRAFTIVELLIVIVIIGVLAVISIISYSGITKKATEATFMSDLANAKKQFALYFAEHGVYPTGLDSNNCLKNSTLTPQVDTNYCLKSGSGNNFVVSDVTSIGYTLTATKGSISYKITNDLPPTLVDLPIGQPLANWTWSQIAQVSSTGTASTYFQVGNTKDITLSTGEVLTMQIYDFNHDDKSDGTGKAGITFGMKNLMTTTRAINSAYQANPYWISSTLYNWLNTTLIAQLPASLQGSVKEVKKYNLAKGNSTSSTENSKLFLFSMKEFTGSGVSVEDVQYALFNGHGSSIDSFYDKYLSNGSGAKTWYWVRNVNSNLLVENSWFVFANDYSFGNFATRDATNDQMGVCFGFSI